MLEYKLKKSFPHRLPLIQNRLATPVLTYVLYLQTEKQDRRESA